MGKNIHVTHRKDEDRWAIKKEGNERASGLYKTQREAIEEGRDIARKEKSDLFIHDRDNKIRDRDSYGNDPFPPKDKKY